jgi:hypothetical protein
MIMNKKIMNKIIWGLVVAFVLSGCGFKPQLIDNKLAQSMKIQALMMQNSPCDTPWGTQIQPGETITVYNTQTTCASSCDGLAVTRTCKNGVIDGPAEYIYNSCKPNVCQSCHLPWGGLIQHNEVTDAFSAEDQPCGGNCGTPQIKSSRKCTNGVLSGDDAFKFSSCSFVNLIS